MSENEHNLLPVIQGGQSGDGGHGREHEHDHDEEHAEDLTVREHALDLAAVRARGASWRSGGM